MRKIYVINGETRILEPQSTNFLIIYSHGDIEHERVSVWFAYTTTFYDMFNYMFALPPHPTKHHGNVAGGFRERGVGPVVDLLM